jgi:hypothetical protein
MVTPSAVVSTCAVTRCVFAHGGDLGRGPVPGEVVVHRDAQVIHRLEEPDLEQSVDRRLGRPVPLELGPVDDAVALEALGEA